jgi:hypothetical protein
MVADVPFRHFRHQQPEQGFVRCRAGTATLLKHFIVHGEHSGQFQITQMYENLLTRHGSPPKGARIPRSWPWKEGALPRRGLFFHIP